MKVSPAKENILKKIRQALSHSTPIPFPQSEGNISVFQPAHQELEVEFAEQFTKLQGKFIFCADLKEMAMQLNSLVKHNAWSKLFCREDKLRAILQKNNFTEFSETSLNDCE